MGFTEILVLMYSAAQWGCFFGFVASILRFLFVGTRSHPYRGKG